MFHALSQIAYIAASSLFILALYWMNTPATARKGVYAGVAETGTSSVGDAVNLQMRDIGRTRQLLSDAARKSKRFVFGAATKAIDRITL